MDLGPSAFMTTTIQWVLIEAAPMSPEATSTMATSAIQLSPLVKAWQLKS
jgi:hypothetical protein